MVKHDHLLDIFLQKALLAIRLYNARLALAESYFQF